MVDRLGEHGIDTAVPAMPNSAEPELAAWTAAAREAIGEPDEGLAIISHSLGAITGLRALDECDGEWRLGMFVAVAGCLETPEQLPQLAPFFETPVDLERTMRRTRRILSMRSDNDAIVLPMESAALAARLRAEARIVPGGEHFLGVQGWTEFPQLKEWILGA